MKTECHLPLYIFADDFLLCANPFTSGPQGTILTPHPWEWIRDGNPVISNAWSPRKKEIRRVDLVDPGSTHQ